MDGGRKAGTPVPWNWIDLNGFHGHLFCRGASQVNRGPWNLIVLFGTNLTSSVGQAAL